MRRLKAIAAFLVNAAHTYDEVADEVERLAEANERLIEANEHLTVDLAGTRLDLVFARAHLDAAHLDAAHLDAARTSLRYEHRRADMLALRLDRIASLAGPDSTGRLADLVGIDTETTTGRAEVTSPTTPVTLDSGTHRRLRLTGKLAGHRD